MTYKTTYLQYVYYMFTYTIVYNAKKKKKQGMEWANIDCWNTAVLHKSRLDRLEEGLPYSLESTMWFVL